MPDSPRNLIVVTSVENWGRTAALGWSTVGMKSTRRKMACSLKPGDRIIAYYTGVKRFGAILDVTSATFEDHSPIWSSPDKPKEDYPYRVHTSPQIVLGAEQRVDAQSLSARMAWTQKWPAQNWTLAYQGNLHEIPDADFELIRTEMKEAAGGVVAAG